ncbi:MAG: glycosyltransferase family 2 protein [Rudaea sp.]
MSLLVGVTAVKNEADIIEACVRHNLRYLDRMIVLDHDSSDATPQILQSLVAEGLPLTLSGLREPDPAFKQAQLTTGLARTAFEKAGADFVFPLDADEFLRAPSRVALEAALHAGESGVANLRWLTYVPSPEEAPGHPLHSLRWRVDTDRPALSKVVISRAILAKNWHIGRGNHVVYDQVGPDLHWTAGEPLVGMSLAHLPLRSPQQLVAKALIGWLTRKLSYGPSAGTTSNSWHLHEMFQRVVAGGGITPAQVQDYAIDVYALGRKSASDPRESFRLVEDPIAAPMPLLYTPDHPAEPTQLLALWSEQLIDNFFQAAVPRPMPAESASG